MLLVSSINFSLPTWLIVAGWIHSDMKGSNGGFRHWQVSGPAISGVAACYSSTNVDFASFQPLRSQHKPSRLVFCLHLCPTTILYCNFCPPFPAHPMQTFMILPGMSIYSQIFQSNVVGASVSSNQCREALKHSEMVYLLCRFRSRAQNPWLVIVL